MSDKKKRVPRVRVLFVCTGNTCRSPMAEFIFKDWLRRKKLSRRFLVTSAGISAEAGAPMTEEAAAALKALDVRFTPRTAVQLTLKAAESADLIVCMTEGHKRAIGTSPKLVTIAELTDGEPVLDPYGQGAAVYLKCAEHLRYACEDIFAEIERRFPDRVHTDGSPAA